MLTLAFDTSAAHCAVALLSGEDVLSEIFEPMTKGQAERLMVLCEDMLQHAGQSWSDLGLIGVGIGPGNFTGIRIAVSAARGLALSLNVPAIGVSSLETLVLQSGLETPVMASIDARQEKHYVQTFFQGAAVNDPELIERDAISSDQADLTIIGHEAAQIAARMGVKSGADSVSNPAIIIAKAAQSKARAPQPRPAPLYVRTPDAAPGRDIPPTIIG